MDPSSDRAPDRLPRILIADDDPQMRELLLGLVQDLGYDARAVPDGTAAVAAVTATPPDLVLSDVGMPGLSGFDLCRRLKSDPATRLIPVVLITAIGEEYKSAGIEAGADDFLSKPFQLGELRVRMRSLLRMKAYTDELESAEAVLCTLGKSIEAKDRSTEGHCERLAELSVDLGRTLGLGEADLTALRRGGYLHDLGKVAIPEAILLKSGPLSAGEREAMQRHPVIGEEICRPLRSFHGVLPIIRHHHERGDGSGYPDGLRGKAIPLTARVLQIVDIFDALTTSRPYRQALPPDRALDVLDAETRKGWWDPGVVRGFRSLINGRNGDGLRKEG